ncbi:MAG: DegT/DnrJ/EryC1/StrS family aminotransferase, partial [Polyangiales bacterium]
MHVPLVDLSAQLPLIEQEIREGWTRVINQGGFILGDDVAALEVELAAFSGSRHCIGVANGTDAIELACRALGIGVGDEVILPANTFIATALGVARAGATPVLVDIDPVYHLIDPQQVARRITSKTRAILPVHLFGQMAPMRPLLELAQAHELSLIEDCAQAHGARQYGQRAGTLGAAAAYSFYPGKNLGAFGDAGAVTTDHAPLATKLYGLRNYGSQIKYHHPELG